MRRSAGTRLRRMESLGNNTNYDDIIMLPRPVSSAHPAMPVADRAAQFMPFAALTGYGEAIDETGRRTEERMELDEDEACVLDEKLRRLQERAEECREVSVTYFQPDARKAGGAYVTITGRIRKIDGYKRSLVMEDGMHIPFGEIVGLEGDDIMD